MKPKSDWKVTKMWLNGLALQFSHLSRPFSYEVLIVVAILNLFLSPFNEELCKKDFGKWSNFKATIVGFLLYFMLVYCQKYHIIDHISILTFIGLKGKGPSYGRFYHCLRDFVLLLYSVSVAYIVGLTIQMNHRGSYRYGEWYQLSRCWGRLKILEQLKLC